MSYMSNFVKEITNIEDELGEKIICATWEIFKHYNETFLHRYYRANAKAGLVQDRETTLDVMNYEHNSSYGSQECHAILAWTENYVIYVHEYDGSTCLTSKPRNPPKGITV
jgi:hypothetical protein